MSNGTHRVVFCAELFRLICDNCDDTTLSRLSRTNKDLQQIALDALWFEIVNLGVLVRCMPQDLWKEKPVELVENDRVVELSIRRPIQLTDWTRFKLHAARVRRYVATSITYGPNPNRMYYHCGTEVCDALFSAARSVPLLPLVRQIIWNRRDDASFPHIKQLLSPFSRDLSLIWTKNSQSNKMRLLVLQGLIEEQPSMTRFRVTFEVIRRNIDLTDWRNVLSTISAWSSLRSLDITNFPESAINLLFDLPALTDLGLYDCLENAFTIPPSRAKGFRSLKRLAVSDCRVTFGLRLIKAMLQAPLQSLDIVFDENPSTDEWLELFMMMRDHLAPQSLREISLHSYMYLSCVENPHPLTLGMLSLLFVFDRLSKLSLDERDGFGLDDNAIDLICSTWPCLQTLKLNTVDFRGFELDLREIADRRKAMLVRPHAPSQS